MDNRQLLAIIKGHRANALGANEGALAAERADAMDRYHGRPYGTEEEGRSAVVSHDLKELVGWAMPAIMRVFTQSGNIGEFEPENAQDEDLAQQQSDVINKIVMEKCDGFLVLYDACKDALILKNGYTKQWWEETEKVDYEEYSGLTIDELTRLMMSLEGEGAAVEVTEQESSTVVMEAPEGPQPLEVFSVCLRITRKEKRVRVMAVPPEEIRVSRKCRGPLSESPFVEHVTRKFRSDLIEMGMPRAFVDSLPAYPGDDNDTEKVARDSTDDESDALEISDSDRSMDEIEYCEAYLRVDWDKDGVAELRKVITVADRIPPGKEWNEQIDEVPITGGVPDRVPHRHVGESLNDMIEDLAEIKTSLMRQALDNLYATNNSQWLVNERVNIKDFLTSLPGGVKRVKGIDPVSGSAEPVMATPVLNQILPAIDYIDRVKMGRTGINESSTGMDPDTLKQSTKGAFLENMNRASQKVEMITRLLAETLVKPMLLQVHNLLIKHQDKPMVMKLRGKYVPVNPQEWRERSDLTIKVGLGTGNSEEKQQKLMLAAQVQEKAAALGLVGPQEGYNLATELFEALGFDMPEKYLISPDPQNPKWQEVQQQMQGKKDPLVQAEEVKGQATLQKAQMDQQGAEKQAMIDAELAREKLQMEMAFKEREAQIKAETEKEIAIINARVEVEKEQLKAQYTVKASYAANPAYGMKKSEEDMQMEASEKEQLSMFLAQLHGAVEEIKGAVASLHGEVNAPAQITERGPDGRAAKIRKGSREMTVVRGPDGRAVGVQ